VTAPRPFTIVVTGSECTGKSTLALALAARLNVPCSAEFAREYVDRGRSSLDASDVEPIARGQLAGELAADQQARAQGRGRVIRDTDLLSTEVYARHYYGDCPEWIRAAARDRLGDLYLLLCPDVPWVPDGAQRDRPDAAQRSQLHELFRSALLDAGVRFVEISGDWTDRESQAFAAIARAPVPR
jgi:NadR type nicotinamide-nucleotide adenylyltransferase